MRKLTVALLLALSTGCAHAPPPLEFCDPEFVTLPPTAEGPPLPSTTSPFALAPPLAPANPIHVPVSHRDAAWDQIVDVVDDYFRIQNEKRVQQVGDVLVEGRIDTIPLTGATLLEPWRHDSAGYANRLESTLQTIRRQATIRVIPAQGGFLVEAIVQKELEDRAQPFPPLAGDATFRTTFGQAESSDQAPEVQAHLGWISLGRDPALEQEILAQIQARLGGFMPGPSY